MAVPAMFSHVSHVTPGSQPPLKHVSNDPAIQLHIVPASLSSSVRPAGQS